MTTSSYVIFQNIAYNFFTTCQNVPFALKDMSAMLHSNADFHYSIEMFLTSVKQF